MPRYYFDVRVGDNFTEDREGLEFAGIEAAQDEAVRALGEMAKDALPGAVEREMAVEVRDERKQPLLRADLSFYMRRLT